MEDLQDVIDISDEQESVSASLKAIISKLKKINELIKIVDSTEGCWTVVAGYEKEPNGSDSDDCKRIRQAETRALKKKNTEKLKSGDFKPSSTLWNRTSTTTLQQVVASSSSSSSQQVVLNPLSVSKKGKKRLILDLRLRK